MPERFYAIVLRDLQSLDGDGNQVVNVRTLDRAKEIVKGIIEEYPLYYSSNTVVTSEDGLSMYDEYQELFDITIYETRFID